MALKRLFNIKHAYVYVVCIHLRAQILWNYVFVVFMNE